jgi:ABC-type multidrug transport system fused ATPase/permease subunit
VRIVDCTVPVAGALFTICVLDGLAARDTYLFWRGVWGSLAAGVIGSVSGGIGINLRVTLVEKLARKQREALARSVVGMPLIDSERLARGDLASRLTFDINESSRTFTECYFLLRAALSAIAAAVYMLILNWQIALACMLTGPLTLLISGLISRSVNKRATEVQRAMGAVSSEALNSLEGIVAIKSFCVEDVFLDRFVAKAAAVRSAGVRLGKVFSLNTTWIRTGSILPFVVTFGYGGYMALQGRLTVGEIMALVQLCNNLAWPLSSMGQQVAAIRSSLAAFRRIDEIISATQDVDPSISEDVPPKDRYSVLVKNLSFEYLPGNPVLNDVSFEVPLGYLVVLVGKSGCGKSTLLKILAGLYRPSSGTVFVEGHDLHYDAVNWGRKVTAYLPQEPFLFSGTIRENLELANRAASDVEQQKVLFIADARFVESLQGGLDAEVAERGMSLSGGERQRLCIARTLLKESSIILIDEPTSAVDRESEELIWASLRKAMKGKPASPQLTDWI